MRLNDKGATMVAESTYGSPEPSRQEVIDHYIKLWNLAIGKVEPEVDMYHLVPKNLDTLDE